MKYSAAVLIFLIVGCGQSTPPEPSKIWRIETDGANIESRDGTIEAVFPVEKCLIGTGKIQNRKITFSENHYQNQESQSVLGLIGSVISFVVKILTQ